MQLGNPTGLRLVKGVEVKSRGKSKGFGFEFGLEIPDIEGVVDAAQIGALFVAELIDHIRETWFRGQTLPYRKRKITIQMKRRRLLWNSILRHVPTDTKSFNAMIKPIKKELLALVKDDGDIAEIYSYLYKLDRIAWLRQKYTYRKETQRAIKGVQKRKYATGIFIPHPKNPAVNDSGIMLASLHGKFKRTSSYMDPGTNKRVAGKATILLTVAKSRQAAALKAGLHSGNDSYFVNMINVNKRAFRETNNILSHGIYWADQRRTMTAIFTTLKIMYRVAQIGGRI